MSEPAAVDLAPILQILLAGAALAAIALAWLQLRARKQSPAHWLRAVTVLTLFLTFDLVLFGAFTRLTDSGLGCPDWPGCYGSASPVGAHADISAAQAAMPSGPVTHHKAWIEMVHRYMATGVGALILVLTVLTWRQWRRAGPDASTLNPWWPTATLAWVCVQGAFGALTVTMKLFPAIVTLHLLGGLLLLALLALQSQWQTRALAGTPPVSVDAGTRVFLLLASGLLVLQLALGGWVSTNYAVLACTDFPTCQGSWWPAMRFDQGFEIWRSLGMTGEGTAISFAALTAIHYAHRLMAYVVLVVLALLAWRLARIDGLRRLARWIGGLAALQLATGLGNVVLGWPLIAALLHTGGAAALVVVITWAMASTRSAQQQASPSRVALPMGSLR
ncbi:MAG: COX15/CtaA family protein [Rhodoferax sp.]|nr:COX15/CtaA family protein [Rhodoferax sp.]MCB2030208.1 COX15/CtaA family protein [Rhodoferax sp.]MCP5262758.1 COX15/CtaA family protein [Rhodoferax sp.]